MIIVLVSLTYLFPVYAFSTPEKHQKTVRFMIFSGGTEIINWEQMSLR